jgi:hypothetical protein
MRVLFRPLLGCSCQQAGNRTAPSRIHARSLAHSVDGDRQQVGRSSLPDGAGRRDAEASGGKERPSRVRHGQARAHSTLTPRQRAPLILTRSEREEERPAQHVRRAGANRIKERQGRLVGRKGRRYRSGADDLRRSSPSVMDGWRRPRSIGKAAVSCVRGVTRRLAWAKGGWERGEKEDARWRL